MTTIASPAGDPTGNEPPIDLAAQEDSLPRDEEFLRRLLIGPAELLDPHIRRLQDGMTVADLLQLLLPAVGHPSESLDSPTTVGPAFTEDAAIFAELYWARLLAVPLPSSQVVTDLLLRNVDAWKQGARSVTYYGTPFPFAVLTCWDVIHKAHASVDGWRNSLRWAARVQQRALAPGTLPAAIGTFIDDTAELANSLRWNGSTVLEDIHIDNKDLADLLSDEWTSQDHINLFLAVLRYDIDHRADDSPDIAPALLPNRLLHVEGCTQILLLYRDLDYIDNRSTHYLHVLGDDIAAGRVSMLGGIFHVEGNHWVAAIVDAPARRILFANSLASGRAPSASPVVLALTWYLGQHGLTGFTVSNLDITAQQDGFSCGILSFSSLAHHFLPDQYRLLPPGRVPATLARMALFHRIIALSTRTADRFPAVWDLAATSSPPEPPKPAQLTIPGMFTGNSRKRTRSDERSEHASSSDDAEKPGVSDSDSDSNSAQSDASFFTKLLLTKNEREGKSKKKSKKGSKRRSAATKKRKGSGVSVLPEVGLKPKPKVSLLQDR